MDIEWKDGEITGATIYSKKGKPCQIRTSKAVRVFCDGKELRPTIPEEDVIEFDTEAGLKYELLVETRE